MIGTKQPSTSSKIVSLGFVALLITSCFVGVASADGTIVDLDEGTPLSERSAWSEWQENGVAKADITAPNLEITLAKDHDDVGVEGWHNDYSNDWVRVEYNEDIPRTIRFYVPSNFWKPYYEEAVRSESGDEITAKFVPVDDGRYTAVTIRFDGKAEAVFPASQVQGSTWSFWSREDERLENATGFSTGIDGSEQWNYASSSDWSNGTLVVENVSEPDRVVIQYDADVSSDSSAWLRVPEGESDRAPAYYFVRESSSSTSGENATIVVVSRESEPPAVRIKRRATARDGIASVFKDWGVMLDRVRNAFDGLFGGGEGD